VCKDVVPDDSSTSSFSVGGPSAGTLSNIGDGQCQTFIGLPPSPPSYTVTETSLDPEAYANTAINCTGDNGSGSGGSITFNLDPGEAASCTFVNEKLEEAHEFVVHKHFTNGNPEDVVVTLSCNAGIVIYDDPTASDADPANFTVHTNLAPSSVLCTATEAVPPGYTVDQSLCVSVQLSVGSCQIINYPQTVAGTPIPVGGQSGLIEAESSGGGISAVVALAGLGLGVAGGVAWVSRRRSRA
jgi:hypothetical protein